MTATSTDLSAIRTDATAYAATFRTLIGVATLTDAAIIVALGYTPISSTVVGVFTVGAANQGVVITPDDSGHGTISNTDISVRKHELCKDNKRSKLSAENGKFDYCNNKLEGMPVTWST